MEFPEKIRKFDTDYFGLSRASAVLNLGMDAMLKAMELEGLGREKLLEAHGAIWMAAHVRYKLERPLFADEAVLLQAEKLKCDGAHVLSEVALQSGGQQLGKIWGAWVLADVSARRILRPKTIPALAEAEAAPKGLFRRGILPPEGAELYRRMVHYSDCDVNGHFNSPRYADCVCDAFWMERFPSGFVSEMQLSFSAESKPGDVLDIRTWQEAGLCLAHAACGGKARFSACFRFSPYKRVR